jgi:hypothetical protein
MRHYLAHAPAEPVTGHAIGVAPAAVPSALKTATGFTHLRPPCLPGALGSAVPIPAVADPAQEEPCSAKQAETLNKIGIVHTEAHAAVDQKPESWDSTDGGGSIPS